MIQLLTGIQTAWNANTFLNATFPNGLEIGAARDSEALPNAIAFIVTAIPSYDTSQTSYTVPIFIQFTVRDSNGDTVVQALDELQKTFDHRPMPMTSDVLLDARIAGLNRIVKEDERIYRADVEFRFTVGRNFSGLD